MAAESRGAGWNRGLRVWCVELQWGPHISNYKQEAERKLGMGYPLRPQTADFGI